MPAERVLLVYYDQARRDAILAGLVEGFEVVPVKMGDGLDLADLATSTQPDILICDLQEQEPAISTLERLSTSNPLPTLLFSSNARPDEVKGALQAGVSVFVVDDLQSERLPTLVEIAKERFRLTNALHEELKRTKDELAARKSIERAKGLLMERRNLTEREAYDAMRRMAMAQGKTVHAIAETILSISDILP